MASATMGLRRRVHQVSSSVTQSSGSGKRTRSENNNSPSQGNLNSLSPEPAPKKSRGSSSSSASSNTRSKAKEMDLAKKASAASSGPPLWSDPRPYASIAGLTLGGQGSLCPEAVGLPSPIPYMSTTMATFVGNATNLGKSSAVSYLDISNMTGRPPGWPADPASGVHDAKASLALGFSAATLASPGSYTSAGSTSAGNQQPPSPLGSGDLTPTTQSAQVTLPKNFPNDSMFNAYQPWVIKTYGDLAKTKTITIKKYARILRTLRGEEANSAENSKFRFWVKSKGFHIGQPEGYDPKPADRIIGRHAVTNPGLDPPLYVPTQPPHNKALNGAEGTVPPGRIYKKVAIVENFFDIIHAVHVDLEGRPGKHAGQKRTYRTITETYAFLPREAVTRFLLGCTECQRRPRTPSPTSLTVTSAPSPPTPTPTPTSTTPTPSVATELPSSPKPATALSSGATESPAGNEKPKEASNPPESKNLAVDNNTDKDEEPARTVTPITATKSPPPPTTTTTVPEVNASSEPASGNVVVKNRMRDEKYNPLSITNLLRKDPITRRPPLPIITSSIQQHIPEPIMATTTITTTIASCPSIPEGSRSPPAICNEYPRKMRMLSDECVRRSTPSPLAMTGHPRTWSPALDAKCTPIDYSLPPLAYHKQQERYADQPTAEEAPMEVSSVRPAKKERETPTTTTTTVGAVETTTETSSESESELEDDRGSFSPAAGLIDTNLNLLATIQQLHCQVMLALTERLRPPSSPTASAIGPAATTTVASNGYGVGNDS